MEDYENWRTEKLPGTGVVQDPTVFEEVNPVVRIHEERVMHEAKLSKVEAETKMVFQQKVAGKESKLKQSEEELHAAADWKKEGHPPYLIRPLYNGCCWLGIYAPLAADWFIPSPLFTLICISYVFSLSAPTPSPSLVSSDSSLSFCAFSLLYGSFTWLFPVGVAVVVNGSPLPLPILAYPDVAMNTFRYLL